MIPITHNTIIAPFVLNIAIGIQPRFKTTTALCQNNSLQQVSITTQSDGTTCYNKTMISTNMITTTNTIQSSADHDDDDNQDGDDDDDRDDDNDDAV